MADSRLDRWAETLVHYCTALQPGERVLLRCSPLAEPLLIPLYRCCLEAGALPTTLFGLNRLQEQLLKIGTDEQIQAISPLEETAARDFEVSITILSEENTRGLSGVDPARQRLHAGARRILRKRSFAEGASGKRRWCLTLFPTQAYAQDAGMSLSDYEEFVYGACFLTEDDPAARWKQLGAEQQRLMERLEGKKTVRILAPDTDLELSIEGRTFINSDGKRNFPSGEFFTGPVEDSAHGDIRFTFPAIFGGREVEDVRLRFEDGRVVEATAGRNDAYLNEMLALDEGAKRLGEFAFGNNFGIRQFTRNILFDEKIGGTIHLALGASYPETGGLNESALHWDMICDLRNADNGGTGAGGEVWVDGELFCQGGRFVGPD